MFGYDGEIMTSCPEQPPFVDPKPPHCQIMKQEQTASQLAMPFRSIVIWLAKLKGPERFGMIGASKISTATCAVFNTSTRVTP